MNTSFPRPSTRRTRLVWGMLLAAVLIVAAVLRLAGLNQLPPGLSYDEAFNVLMASQVKSLLPPPVYIPVEFGQESAHDVLIAILFRLAGHPFAEGGRWVSALAGVFTVGMLFLAVREMFQSWLAKDEAIALGLLSAGVLSVLYWHVHASRLGMEPPMTPTFTVVAVYLFWLAVNRRRWYWFALAGAALGLCPYTYLAGYAVPILFVLYLAWRWGTDRTKLRAEFPGMLLYGASALAVMAPHVVYFLQHPEWIMRRPGQVAASAWYEPILNFFPAFKGLFWQASTDLRLNLPGRPVLDAVQDVALLAGLWRGLRRPQRDGLVFTLIWLVVALLPSTATSPDLHPGRALGAVLPLAIMIALGLHQIYAGVKWWMRRLPAVPGWLPRAAGVFDVVLALAYSGARTARDYFVLWGHDPGLFTAFDVGLRQSVEFLASQPADSLLSLSPTPRDAPLLQFYLGSRGDRFKTFNGRTCVVYPLQPSHNLVHAAILAEEQQSLARLQTVFPSSEIVDKIHAGGNRYAAAVRVPAGSRANIALSPGPIFGGVLELARPVELQPAFRPGETIPITLTWRGIRPMNVDYTSFVHLSRGPDDVPLAQVDAQPCDNSYPTTWWAPGDIVEDTRLIHLPADLAPGEYQLLAGWYDLNTRQRLPLDSGRDRVAMGTIRIGAGQ